MSGRMEVTGITLSAVSSNGAGLISTMEPSSSFLLVLATSRKSQREPSGSRWPLSLQNPHVL